MTYTVVWKPAAEDELARIWTDADDRGAVAEAANEIDRLLRARPHDQGESRGDSTRVTFVYPLGVFFHVSDEDRLVSVLRVLSVSWVRNIVLNQSGTTIVIGRSSAGRM